VADNSFDVVSQVDRQEVDNALNQARKEVSQRFDFKDTGTSIAWSGEQIEIRSATEAKVKAAFEVFKERLVRREISLKALDHEEPKPAAGSTYRLEIKIVQGIDQEKGRAMVKDLKRTGLKVQVQIQDDQVRVSSKSRDELQRAIAQLKEADYAIPLQFVNYR